MRGGRNRSAATWIEGPAKGAKSLRRVGIRGRRRASGTSARGDTPGAMLDRDFRQAGGVRQDVLAPFRAG